MMEPLKYCLSLYFFTALTFQQNNGVLNNQVLLIILSSHFLVAGVSGWAVAPQNCQYNLWSYIQADLLPGA